MTRCLKVELKKAFFQKKMYLLLLFLSILSIVQARGAIQIGRSVLEQEFSGNPQLTSASAYIRWIGTDTGSFESTLFYFLLPVFSTLPFGWSLAGELQSGYTAHTIGRCGRGRYFAAKVISAFLSGMFAVVFPLLLNFLLVSMFLPSLTPEVLYPYGNLLQKSMWSDLYYTQLLFYAALYILLDGLYSGAFAVFGAVSAFFLKYRTLSVFSPFCLYLLAEYLDSNFIVFTGIGYDTSPARFLRAMAVANDHSAWIAAAELIVLLGISMAILLYRGKRYEVL